MCFIDHDRETLGTAVSTNDNFERANVFEHCVMSWVEENPASVGPDLLLGIAGTLCTIGRFAMFLVESSLDDIATPEKLSSCLNSVAISKHAKSEFM